MQSTARTASEPNGGATPPAGANPGDPTMASRPPAAGANKNDSSEDARLLADLEYWPSGEHRNGLSRHVSNGSDERQDRWAGRVLTQLRRIWTRVPR